MSDLSSQDSDKYDDPHMKESELARAWKRKAQHDQGDFYYQTPQGLLRHKPRKGAQRDEDFDPTDYFASPTDDPCHPDHRAKWPRHHLL